MNIFQTVIFLGLPELWKSCYCIVLLRNTVEESMLQIYTFVKTNEIIDNSHLGSYLPGMERRLPAMHQSQDHQESHSQS